MSKRKVIKSVTLTSRPHTSRKVIFTELFSELLMWGEDIGLTALQMTDLIDGFKAVQMPTTGSSTNVTFNISAEDDD